MKKIVVVVSVIFLFLLGAFFLVSSRKAEKSDKEITPTPVKTLPMVDPSVEIDLTPRADKRAVILTLASLANDVTSVDYELTYEAQGGLPRGVLGRIDIDKDAEIKREILLGTCSGNRCVYDEGVKEVKLVLKFNSPKGSSQFQQTYPL